MKRGLELLKQKRQTNKLNKLKALEEEFDLPEIFNIFLNTFELGQNGFLNAKRLFEEILLPITSVEYRSKLLDANLRISHFYGVEKLYEKWNDELEFSQCEVQDMLFPIAYTEIELDHILIKLDETGSIWYSDNEPKSLATNVFDFCINLFETEINDNDYVGSNVYKNLGEDFWRIKEGL